MHRFLASVLVFFAVILSLSARTGVAQDAVRDAEGLWEYTGLLTRDGVSLPLTGVFLISEGTFLQQSIFNDEPFAMAGSMAHVGPYWGGGAGLRLTSTQTLSLDPGAETPLRSAGALEHDLSVLRRGNELTLTFGAGTSTVQTFERLGDGADTRLYALKDGALAFANGYFILVVGNDDRVVSGYGAYRQDGSALELSIMRWAESDGEAVSNRRNEIMKATFDEQVLKLDDGRQFSVAR